VFPVAFGTHTEHLQLDVLSSQYCMTRPPVYFCFKLRLGIQRNRDQRGVKPKQSAGIMHVLPHCSVTALKALFITQSRVDPFCSAALLFGTAGRSEAFNVGQLPLIRKLILVGPRSVVHVAEFPIPLLSGYEKYHL